MTSARRIVGLVDGIYVLLLVAILQTSRGGMLDDPGLGWHIANVTAMLDSGSFLTADPFSRPRLGERYFTNQWLGDVVLWAADRWGGLNGIAAVTTIVFAATLTTLFRQLSKNEISWPIAALWTYLAALGTSGSWVARPNMLTILFFLILANALSSRDHRRWKGREYAGVVLLFIIWANAHGGFVAGLLLIAANALLEGASAAFTAAPVQRSRGFERSRDLGVLLAMCLVATLVNPYGGRLYPWIFGLLGDPYFMNLNSDWRSTDFHVAGAFRFELFLLATPLLLAYSRRRAPIVVMGVFLLLDHFALQGRRYQPLWILFATPVLARTSQSIALLRRCWSRYSLSPELRASLSSSARPTWGMGIALSTVALLIWARLAAPFAGFDASRVPTSVLDQLVEIHRGRPIFNDYNWGGYLTWKGWFPTPENLRFPTQGTSLSRTGPDARESADGAKPLLTFVDDRNEVMGRPHLEEYFDIIHTAPGWRERLDRQNIKLVCVPARTPLAFRLCESPDWTILARQGDDAILFERR